MKNHLKRISSPRTWILNRRAGKFTLRPNSGGQALGMGLPLGVILRDKLHLTSTMDEAKKLLKNKEVRVDGKPRKDHRFMVGLFDVVNIVDLKKSYRVIFDQKGRVVLADVPSKEQDIKLCKVTGKMMIAKNQVQFNLHDGKNILAKQKAKVGDTFVVKLPSLEILEVLPLQTGATIFLTKGKHSGDLGTLKSLVGKDAIYIKDGKEIGTSKQYLFVVGKDKPAFEMKK